MGVCNIFVPNRRWMERKRLVKIVSTYFQVKLNYVLYYHPGKGLTIWDTFVHREDSRVNNKATGDIACDSYHKYKEDVQLLKLYGVYL